MTESRALLGSGRERVVSVRRMRAAIGDVAWLNARLDETGRWSGGRIVSVGSERIGLGYGLSGEIRRLHCTTDRSDHATLVAKIEDAPKIQRALSARRHVAEHLGRSIPRLWGAHLSADGDGGSGVLLLEDVRPAEQGDELRPVSHRQAADLVSIVRRLHCAPVAEELDLERWAPRPVSGHGWASALVRLDHQLTGFDDAWWHRIERIGEEADAGVRSLRDRPFVWIHTDPHLDNVMWRTDGSIVLLDWSNARLGPAAVDGAILLFSLCFGPHPSLSPDDLIGMLAPGTSSAATATFRRDVRAAVTAHLRAVLGWMGRPGEDVHRRAGALRDDAVGRIDRAVAWLDAPTGRSRT